MRTAFLLVVLGLTGTLLACGQKGPLVLPDAQHPHKKIGAPKSPVSTPPPATPAGPPPAGPTPAPADPTAAGGSNSGPAQPQ